MGTSGGVAFSAEELALIAALLTALSTPLAILFWALRGSYIDRISDYREALTESRRRNDDLRPAVEKLTESVRDQTLLIRQLIERREGAR